MIRTNLFTVYETIFYDKNSVMTMSWVITNGSIMYEVAYKDSVCHSPT